MTCGENISDHLPITYILDLPNMVTQGISPRPSCIQSDTKEMWDKADMLFYSNTSGLLLQSINIPTHMFTCSAGCDCIDHYVDNT